MLKANGKKSNSALRLTKNRMVKDELNEARLVEKLKSFFVIFYAFGKWVYS